jgi:hypothetical protein
MSVWKSFQAIALLLESNQLIMAEFQNLWAICPKEFIVEVIMNVLVACGGEILGTIQVAITDTDGGTFRVMTPDRYIDWENRPDQGIDGIPMLVLPVELISEEGIRPKVYRYLEGDSTMKSWHYLTLTD